MEYSHTYIPDRKIGIAFKTGIAINLVFIVIETLAGFVTNSSALLADAGHNLSDVLALLFSWIAILLSQRKPTLKFTYGFRRSTILVALFNTILLLLAVGFIIFKTFQKINKPQEIHSGSMILIAGAGIIINAFTAWLFMKGKDNDLNIRSTFIHFFSDALVSLGVVIAGLMIKITGALWIDPLVSFIIIAVILYSSYKLLVDSIDLVLDAVPGNIEINKVLDYLSNLPEVKGVHDLHIWSLSTSDVALTVHLQTSLPTDVHFISSIQKYLNEHFNIEHSTVQVEYENNS